MPPWIGAALPTDLLAACVWHPVLVQNPHDQQTQDCESDGSHRWAHCHFAVRTLLILAEAAMTGTDLTCNFNCDLARFRDILQKAKDLTHAAWRRATLEHVTDAPFLKRFFPDDLT